MKKGLGMLMITLLLNSIAFSQTVTPDSCETRLPCETARRVVIDLLEGDLAKRELELTQEKLRLTDQIINSQNEIIASHRIKVQAYDEQIEMHVQKEVLYKSIVNGLEKDKRALKKTVKFLGVSIGVVAITTVVGFLVN